MEFAQRLKSTEQERKPRSVYKSLQTRVPLDRNHQTTNVGIGPHFLTVKLSERSVRSYSSSDLDPQTDSDDDSDTSRRMTTSN